MQRDVQNTQWKSQGVNEKEKLVAAARKAHDAVGLPNAFVEYEVTASVEKELEVAREVHAELEQSLDNALASYSENSELDVEEVKVSTNHLVDSMIRNPDASFLLARLKSQDAYSYSHSVEASVLAIMFGRHLGLTEEELNKLALGVLLLDIGKLKLPTALLDKVGKLHHVEVRLLKQHVDYSIEVLSETSGLDPEVLSIVSYHHERVDGKGYPKGMKGSEIPVYARIAAIVDFYDAYTHPRPYRPAHSTSQAINALYNSSGTRFQPELVEEFIQCLGVYPTGSLVLLSTGEVGIVIEQNPLRRLRPTVLIVRDSDKQEVEMPFNRDLAMELVDKNGKKLFIDSALKPGDYGVSADDFYL
jgi:HD-GYP domain-containing protein (c-di-GMP phosphodiesterase class II)